MATPIIYGIKNCDTMKKAFKWLETKDIDYHFHDYKKENVDNLVLSSAIDQHGWENVINQRGTTWRKLPENVKNKMNAKTAIKIATENPSIIKRPLLSHKKKIHLGFKEEDYKKIFIK